MHSIIWRLFRKCKCDEIRWFSWWQAVHAYLWSVQVDIFYCNSNKSVAFVIPRSTHIIYIINYQTQIQVKKKHLGAYCYKECVEVLIVTEQRKVNWGCIMKKMGKAGLYCTLYPVGCPEVLSGISRKDRWKECEVENKWRQQAHKEVVTLLLAFRHWNKDRKLQ